MNEKFKSMFVKKGISKEQKEEIKLLEERIIQERKLYYQGEARISDKEYDELEKKLKDLDSSNYLFNEVGFDISTSNFEKHYHDSPMLSLEKAYEESEMKNWHKDWLDSEMFSVGSKIDGFAISLIYKFHQNINDILTYKLDLASSRGNGEIGENITENVKMITDIPQTISFSKKNFEIVPKLEIRGEIYMKKDIFKELKERGLIEENARLRNIAAGSTRQKNPLTTKQRKLNFLAYNLLNLEFETFFEKIAFIKNELKFPVVEQILVSKQSMNSIHKFIQNKRSELPFNIDGVVFRINKEKLFNEAGETGHHPKGAIAWKFEAEVEVSKLINVEWQTTRTGLINPVAIYEPVEVDGAILSKATLHNLSFMNDLNIKIGSEIEIARQGGVIPKILKVLKNDESTTEIIIPDKCPECGCKTEIRINEDSINRTKTLNCPNESCPAVMKDKINHFCSVLDIKGVSYSTIEKLYEMNLVNTFSDLFKLKVQDLLKLDGFKTKSAENIINSINDSRKKPFNIILQSFGINGLGKTLSLNLSKKYKNLEEIINHLINDAEGIDGISPEMAKKIIEDIIKIKPEMNKIFSEIEIQSKQISNDILKGKTFCITGTLSKGRNEFEKLILENGGQISSSVSKKLDFLLCGEDAGSKLEKAKSINIKIINETEFNQILSDK